MGVFNFLKNLFSEKTEKKSVSVKKEVNPIVETVVVEEKKPKKTTTAKPKPKKPATASKSNKSMKNK